MLDQLYYNNTLQNWLISGGIIISALIINRIITIINRKYLKALTKRTKNYIDNILVVTLETPLKVGIVLIAIWTAFHRLELSKSFDDAIYKAYEILTVLNVTWFVVHLVNGLISEYFHRKNQSNIENNKKIFFDTHLISIIRKTSMFIIWTIGIVTALNNIGMELKAILGTLGISGIAVALAAQDTVKNIFGGFTILLDGTFRIGDKIKIGDIEGQVEDIGIRSTKIRNYDKRLITMSNFKIMEGAVTNISAAPMWRIVSNIGLEYDTSPQKMNQAIEILKDITKKNSSIEKEGVSATFEEFGEYALKLRFCYFFKDTFDRFETVSNINLEVLQRFNDAGIAFAFPTQTLLIEKMKINAVQ